MNPGRHGLSGQFLAMEIRDGNAKFIDMPCLKQHSSNNVPEMPSYMLIHVRLFASDARGFAWVHLPSGQHGTITQPQCTENLN